MRQVALTCYWLAAGLVSPLAWGQGIPAQPEGIQWLQRISTAAQKLSYSGTFIYRNGTRSEISRRPMASRLNPITSDDTAAQGIKDMCGQTSIMP